jgi:class 3 adenylate cyclase/tetratricopeptide (TPR) repeat protein
VPTATILVTDLVGSTELRSRIGDEHAERLRRLHDRLSRSAVETHGGVVVKGLGDGVLASFPEASAALAAAVAIQQAADAHTRRHPDLPLVLRVGLSAGDVTVDAGDCFGTPVVEASRLCAAAEGGRVLAAEVVRLLVKGRAGFTLDPVGELELKGLAEPVTTSEVIWERPADAVSLPFPKLLSTEGEFRFTGRVSEVETLRAAWKQAAAGEPSSVLVGGEPGVGKTRLMAELARAVHEDGAAVLYGRCEEALGVPYEPFVEALAFFCEHTAPADLRPRLGRYPGELVRLLPEVGELVPGLDPPLRSDPETEQYRLFQAVASWLAAAGEASGLLFVIDDLHWAAPPTLRLVAHVLQASAAARLLLVGTFRDTEVGQELSPLLADLRRTSTTRIALEGLTVDELTELLPAPALAATLHEETKGNPFFVGEILRYGVESGIALQSLAVPEGARDVILSRVARLAEGTGDVLAVAAVMGRDIEVVPVTLVSGVGQEEVIDALDEAAAVRLVEETGPGNYRFVHALVRSALESTLSATRKARLHLRAADAFPDDPARLARHLLASAPLADRARTAHACLAAGDRALRVLADAEAADWYRRGLDNIEGDGPVRIDLLTGLGEAQRRTGDPASRQTLLDASRLAIRTGDAARAARAVLANSRGVTSVVGHVDQERLDLVETTLDLVGSSPSAERAELLALQAAELQYGGDHQRVLRAADEAAAIATDLADVAVRARVGIRRFQACLVPERVPAMAAEGADVVALADAVGDPQPRALARTIWAFALTAVGDLAAARRCSTEAMAIAEETGEPGLRALAHNYHAAVVDALGDHAEAVRLTDVAVELGQQVGWPDAIMFYGARLWPHWTFEGKTDIAATVAAQAYAEYPMLVAWHGGWAWDIALAGGGDELTAFLAELPSLLPTVPIDMFWLTAHFTFAAAQGFGAEDARAASALYEVLAPYRSLHATYGLGYFGPVEVALAIAARVMGDCERALVHHEAAAATIEASGAARARALNGDQWARTLLARNTAGDRQRALELAEGTLDYCRTKGYATLVTKTEELLADLR